MENVLQGVAGGTITKGCFVFEDSSDSGKIKQLASDTSLECCGVAKHDAVSGEKIFYAAEGSYTSVKAGGVILPGAIVMTNADGEAITATTGKVKLARYRAGLEGAGADKVSAADGDLINVLILSDLTNTVA